jgi:NADH-quinone oxidoreductase subunit G
VKRSSVISANKYRKDLIQKPDFALKLAATQFKPIDDTRPYFNDPEEIRNQSMENNEKANHRSLLSRNN